MLSVKVMYNKYQKYIVLFGGFLLNISIGSMYTFDNNKSRINNYMTNFSSNPTSVNETSVMLIFVICIFGMGSSIAIGEYVANKIGPLLTSLITGWFLSINVFLMKFTMRRHISTVILTYGLFNGIASGIVYGVAMGTVYSWFPERRGTVAGILVAGFGLSALPSFAIQNAYMLKDGAKNWMENYSNSFVLLAGCLAVLQLIGALLLKKKDNIETNEINDETIGTSLGVDKLMDSIVESDMKPHNLIFQVDFWILWITFSLLSASIINTSFFEEFGYRIIDNHNMYTVSLCAYLFSAAGGILWGLIIDRFRYKVVMLILTISFAVLSGTYCVLDKFQKKSDNNSMENTVKGSEPLYFIMTFLLRLIPSGVFCIFPKISVEMFGYKNFISNYGMLFTAWSSGALIASLISYQAWEKDASNPSSFFIFNFSIISFMSTLAAILTLVFKGEIRNRRIQVS